MNTHITPNIFGTRDETKSLLAVLLPEVKSGERLELLAHQSGYRSDAALNAQEYPHADLQSAIGTLSKLAAGGNVLPLLVAAGVPLLNETHNRRSTARPVPPSAGEILKAASQMIDRPSFKGALLNLEESARNAPAGPCRWFYSVTASSILFSKEPGTGDKFWLNKSSELLCGVLALAGIYGGDKPIDRDRLEFLQSIEAENCCPWSKPGYDLVRHAQNAPEATRESVLRTMLSHLPRTTPDLGIYPGAL